LSFTHVLSNRCRTGAHRLLCALIAASTASAVQHGQVVWLVGALLLLGAALANATFPTRSVRLLALSPEAVRHRPGFHTFLMGRLGDPLRQPGRFLSNFFLRPLCAPSFRDFWRAWNPVYGYVLLFFVYPTLRRYLPRRAAVYGSFLFSGFFLHDLPFNLPADLSRGRLEIPAVTLLFAIYGGLTLLSEALRIDLSQRPTWLRATANLGWLGIGLTLRNIILTTLHAATLR
jgi:hypothetical protein